jgi:dethiobiotin synthetase
MTAAFVTATGTDIGKTFVCAGVVRHLRGAGRAVEAIKPVVSGFAPDAWRDSDPAALLAALGREPTLEEIARISPWRFAAPLSPDMAAAQEERAIAFDEVAEFCRRGMAAQRRGVLLIEGIGGVMVPLDPRHTLLDLMSALRVPVVLVAGSYVGTLSHTFTALEVLARRNLDIAAVVVSETAGSPAPLADTAAAIARFAGVIEVVPLPRLAPGATDHPAFRRVAEIAGL